MPADSQALDLDISRKSSKIIHPNLMHIMVHLSALKTFASLVSESRIRFWL